MLYRPNEKQKLDIFGNKVFIHDNDMLYCKLRCNVTRLSTPAQWHREWISWRQEVAFFGQPATNFGKERLWPWALKGFNLPPNFFLKWKIIRISAPKQPKNSQSCSKVELHGKNARTRESCAEVALCNIAIFWGLGTIFCIEQLQSVSLYVVCVCILYITGLTVCEALWIIMFVRLAM